MGYDDAFRAIHDRYRQRLFAYTRQMLGGSRTDAEDVLQDVFLRAYGALRNDDRPVTLRAWLYRVAHNRCIDHLRRPVPPAAEVYELSRMPQLDPPGETERREDLRDLVKDVQRLPEQQRSALLMRELDGLSYAELADALGTSVPAIKSLLVRARIGLVEAGEARDAACAEIRAEIELAVGRGVRTSGRSRRHLRDCLGCREYRHALRGAPAGRFAALGGGGPLATLAKLLGIGGASSGAAAGAGAGAGGSAALVGGATAATATKVAAFVCCAAVFGGGAVEVKQHVGAVTPSHRAVVHPRAAARAAKAAPAAAPAIRLTAPIRAIDPLRERATVAAPKHERAGDHGGAAAPAAPGSGDVQSTAPTAPVSTPAVTPPAPEEVQTGGTMAPDEDSLPDANATGGNGAPNVPNATDPAPAAGEPQAPAPEAPSTVAPAGSESGAPVTG
jgi:RNA polymerase sigma factor (sigma-70 family)